MNLEIEILRALNDAPTHLFPEAVLYSQVMHQGEGVAKGQFDAALKQLAAKGEAAVYYGDRIKVGILDAGKQRLANY